MINLKNGLDYDDLLQVAHAINPILLSPELRSDMQTGVNAMLSLAAMIDKIPPWLLPMLPLPPGWREQLTSAVRLAQLAKGLLDA